MDAALPWIIAKWALSASGQENTARLANRDISLPEQGDKNLVSMKSQVDIAKNIRVIEWLKAELVESVAILFKALLRTGDEAVSDCLATIIITTYILGKRVGVSFPHIDLKVESKLRFSINEAHEVEKWYGDLSALLGYLENRKK